MTRLSVERLFDKAPLTLSLPSSLKFSSDGRTAACLQPGDDDRERLDLFRVDVASGALTRWLDARVLTASAGDGATRMSEAEKAERERKRQFSGGITGFFFVPGTPLVLIPIQGIGYLFDWATGQTRPFTPAGMRQTDFQVSPKGTSISYVRGNDLYCYAIESGQEVRITTDGDALIANGIADFIAAEEMHRFEGHWWSPDETRIAFTRTDESPVAVSNRYEIDAEEVRVIEQRYPFAGATNAQVSLKVYSMTDRQTQTIDYQYAPDDYLARVNWAGERLAVQVQSRNQQTLRLDLHDITRLRRRSALTESSPTWVNLHDNFHALEDGRFLWTSERSGSSQLYLCDPGDTQERPAKLSALTSGPGRVNRILQADIHQVLFTGWQETPTEQHVYRLSLADGERRPLTRTPAWHEASADRQGTRLLVSSSSLDRPASVQLLEVQNQSAHDITTQPLAQGHPYFPFLDAHCQPQLGTLKSEDGQVLHYRLSRPRADPPAAGHPLVVYVYGGPGAQRVRNEWAPLTLQLFAQRGFGVLELDNRGSANRSRDFEASLHRQLGQAEVRDQALGARFAQSLEWVDGERIGVFGHSYGGYMTLMCLVREPDLFKAGVAVAPVARWELYDTHYTERYLGTPADNPEGYRISSVLPHLEQLRGRLLLIHGMADDNVLFTHTTLLIRTLQSQNTPFEMMAYPGSKHALQEQDVSIHRFNLILDFFERTL
ncbi:MAG: alpha/beta fold hydrolase [Pseudomonadales bacterium]